MSSNTGDIIQTLNLVHPPVQSAPPQQSNSNSGAQDLLGGHPYTDLAQLDIWTNVAFAPDEPFVHSDVHSDDGSDKDGRESTGRSASSDIVKRRRNYLAKHAHPQQTHSQSQSPQQPPQQTINPAAAPIGSALFPPATNAALTYDLPGFLAISGGAAFATPDAMNLNQLLYGNVNPFAQSAFNFANPFAAAAALAPPSLPTPTALTPSAPSQSHSSSNPPPAKKARRKSSSDSSRIDEPKTSSRASHSHPTHRQRTASLSPSEDASHESHGGGGGAGPDDFPRGLTSSEDKRRRNTQASARFRLKKKEREVAMESKCKDLETKVTELERECEALRRENGWLKGLVVGVTGGTGVSMTMPPGPGLPSMASTASSGKRKRDTASTETSSS